MERKKITKLDIITIAVVAICISSLIFMILEYTKIEPSKYCWYEIEYIHVSGKIFVTKRYCDCDGFRHWHPGSKYKLEMAIPFANGQTVHIQGATDILRVEKLK